MKSYKKSGYLVSNNLEFYENPELLEDIFLAINDIAQEVKKNMGGFHTELMYQNAFEHELSLNSDKFSFLREHPIEVEYKGKVVGGGLGSYNVDFVAIPNKDYFEDTSLAPAILVELKRKYNFDNEFEIGRTSPRQQLWSYLSSCNKSSDKKMNKIEYGVLINFSKKLESHEITEERVWEDDYADLEFWHYDKESSSMSLLLKTDIEEMPKDYRAEFENTMMRIDTGQMPMPYEDDLSEEENENNRKHVLGVANSLQKFAKTHNYDEKFYETFITEDKFHIPLSEEGFKDWMINYYLLYFKTLDGIKVVEINKEI